MRMLMSRRTHARCTCGRTQGQWVPPASRWRRPQLGAMLPADGAIAASGHGYMVINQAARLWSRRRQLRDEQFERERQRTR